MSDNKSSFWKNFDQNKITHSVTHYLFAIDTLNKEQGYARAVDLAKKLDITAWSCSTWLKWLLKKELIIEDENKFIKLTEEAKEIIDWIAKTRKTFIKFFHKELWISKEQSAINACKIEHLIDLEITKKLEKHIDKRQ